MNKEQIDFISAVIKGMPDFTPSLRTQKASCARAFMNAIVWKADAMRFEMANDFDSQQFLIDCGVNNKD
jgi:hypothetical protein